MKVLVRNVFEGMELFMFSISVWANVVSQCSQSFEHSFVYPGARQMDLKTTET